MAANYQGMAGVGGNQMMMQSHNQQPPQGPNLQHMLINSIQSQQLLPTSGWQANVGINERFAQVWHIVSQLRLLSPNQQDLQRLCQMGLQYEKHAFETQPDKDEYLKMIKDKLEALTSARNQTGMNQAQLQAQAAANVQRQAQAQAQQQQMNMVNQAGMQGQMQRAAMGQQAQQPFLHLQHQMQASALPQQQQPGLMGMANNGLPPSMLAQQQQQQQQSQTQQFQTPMQAQQGQHQMQPDIGRSQFQALSQQEAAMVNQLTQRLMANATEEDKNNIRQNLRGRMDQMTLQRYQSQNMDPLILYYRNQALNRLRQEKARQAQVSGQLQQSNGMPGNMNTPSAVAMQQQRSGNAGMMNGQAPQQPQMGANADFGNFLGGMDNLLGQPQQQSQQAGGLLQDMGQIGGPVSMPQGNATPQAMQGLAAQQTGANGQRPLSNPNFRTQQAQQQAFNAQQNQERMNQAGQSQAQIRANAQAKAQQQMALHGQPGGMGPMPPQQSPAMTTLNAPLRTPQQPQPAPSIDPLQMTQPNTAHFGQPLDPRFTQMNAQRASQANPVNGMGMNGPGTVFPANMPQEYRQRVNSLPKDKINDVIMRWNASHPQGAKPQVPMAANVPGTRPNQPVPQGGPFNQQNMPNQFMNMGPNGQPNPQIMANMTPQQQLMLKQRMAQQQGRPNMQSAMSPGEQQAINQIDHLEFPQSVLASNNILRQAPPEVKKWGELKLWVSQNPMAMQANMLETVKAYQRAHYHQIMRSRQNNQARGLPNAPIVGQPQPTPQMIPPGMAPVAPMLQAQVPNAANTMAGVHVSPEDIQKARQHQSGKLANLSNEEIKQIILRNAFVQQQRMQASQVMGQMSQQLQPPQPTPQGQRTPQQAPQRTQNTNQTPKQNNRPQQAQTNASQANSQQHSASSEQAVPTPPMGRGNKGAQTTRTNQATSSSQLTKNNLKRASSDDVVEVPNFSIQQARATQQQTANQQRPLPQGRPQFTPQQLAVMTPDQRKQYQQAIARSQAKMLRGNPAEVQKCNSVMMEEVNKMEPLQNIPMNPEVKLNMSNRLMDAGKNLKKVKMALPKWFAITHDESKLRLFCRTYYKISMQFQDQDTMEKPKDAFSISSTDVDASFALARSMIQDITNQYPNLSKSATGAGAMGAPQPVIAPVKDTAPAQTAPLNAANLQQQQQALKQLNQGKSHNRANNRNAPPPAPTVAQAPPFPTDVLPPALTQDQLRLPRKKQKHSATSTPVLGQQATGPTTATTVKAGSLETKVQQQPQPTEPERAQFHCPEPYCDHHVLDPFEDQAALDKHKEEEHVRPIRKPVPFVLGELSTILSLDENGVSIKPSTTPIPAAGVARSAAVSKPGSTTTAVGMTSMDRQMSVNGVKTSPANSMSLKTTKSDDLKEGTQQAKNYKQAEVSKTAPVEINLWAESAVNPQDLMHNFQHLETGAGGAIYDMNVYRSITPNDTPESSKDGVSEPNSDISEGLDLSIALDWQPFGPTDGEDLLDIYKINVNPDEEMTGMFGDENSQFVPWNDFVDQSAFDKSFVFDTSLFSMNAELD